MPGDAAFQLLVVAIDEYASLGALPSSASATTLERRLSEWATIDPRRATSTKASAHEIRTALSTWTNDGSAASSSFVYWAGHGWDDGDKQFLLTTESTSRPDASNSVPAAELASFLMQDWERRDASGDPLAWTVVVLDCCGAPVGVTNIANELTKQPTRRPRRCVVFPVNEEGASFAGRFVEKLCEALDALTPNDSQVSLRELLWAVADRLGGDLEPDGNLPAAVALIRAEPAEGVVIANLGALEELNRRLDELPSAVRSHFFAKAAGAETNEPAWFFSGRHAEVARLASWLRDATSGLFVVTGEAGSGKSAILGHLVTLADPVLVHALRDAELLDRAPEASRPPDDVFDLVLHLTGMTDADVQRGAAEKLDVSDWRAGGLETALAARAAEGRRFTILADALDEAQEPLVVAKTLRRLANLHAVRVVVGTRRSLDETIGAEPTGDGELIRALGVFDSPEPQMVVRRDRDAVESYVKRRLATPRSPYADRTDDIDALASRIGGRDQPFLYARLATGELLERPPYQLDEPALAELLRSDYVGLFAAAVARLSATNPETRALLDALAWGRGRGLPRAGGTWATVAAAIRAEPSERGTRIGEDVLDRILVDAAPYVVLDGEMGQSTYRLAHQTFVEHLQSEYPAPVGRDLAIATALQEAVAAQGGWETANPYVVRYLPQHLASQPERLELLGTDIAYLRRAFEVLGVDGLVDLLREAAEASGRNSLLVLAALIRRGRVALERDRRQFDAQLYARLLSEQEGALRRLTADIAESASPVWLRARTSRLGWTNELDTIQTMPAKARAVAFGRAGGEPVAAVGAGTTVFMWDPRSATFHPLPELPYRVTAVGIDTVDGRGFVLAVGGYDGAVSLFDVDRGEWRDVNVPLDAGVASVCLATLNGRLAVAAASIGEGARVWDCDTGELLHEGKASAHAIAKSRLGLIVAEVNPAEDRCRVRNLVSGATVAAVGDVPPLAYGMLRPLAALGDVGGVPFVAVADGQTGIASVWEVGKGSRVAIGIVFNTAIRSLAIGEVDGRPVLLAANESDAEAGFIIVREVRRSSPRHYATEAFFHGAVLGARQVAAEVRVLVESDGVIDAVTGQVVDGKPSKETVSELVVGPSNAVFDVTSQDAADGATEPRAFEPTRRIERHTEWPETALAYGVIDGRVVKARGSYDGMVVVFDARTNHVVAAGPCELPHVVRLGVKPSPPTVASVAIGVDGDREPLIALACDGLVQLRDARTLENVPSDWIRALSATGVSLGLVHGVPVLATGGEGGAIALWDLESRRRLAGITLDLGIYDVTLVAGDDVLVARTVDGFFHVFDVVTR